MKLGQGELNIFLANPCSPCNSNPDPMAVRVTIQFPRYTYPVFFPLSAPETCSFILRLEGGRDERGRGKSYSEKFSWPNEYLKDSRKYICKISLIYF